MSRMHGVATLCSQCKYKQGIMTYVKRVGDAKETGYLCGSCSEKFPVCLHCRELVIDVGFQVRYHGQDGLLCKGCARAEVPIPA